MSLDVDAPSPPELEPHTDADEYEDVDVQGSEYRREELGTFLDEGAWEQAFDEWAEGTDIDEETFDIVRDLDLVQRFDFFWDDFADRVGYHAPGIPEDWREHEVHPDLDSWEQVSAINAGMAELGQTVCEVLKSDYIDWDADYEPPDELPDFE